LLSSTPELNNFPPTQWDKTFKHLTSLGFKPRKYTYMISQYPKLLSMPEDKLKESLNHWLNFEFGENETFQLLERFPELLEISNFRKVHDNLTIIKELVGQKNGYKVLLTTPTIVNESVQNLEEKCDYLRDKMKVDPVEVYKSDVFSRDIFKIKARHIFMERLGLYVTKKKRNDDEEGEHTVNKNEKLYKIMDTSDKKFASKVCHVTLEEYETFEDLYRKELSENDEVDSDQDDSHHYYNN
jgi:mTERF domain-containing protein